MKAKGQLSAHKYPAREQLADANQIQSSSSQYQFISSIAIKLLSYYL
jgi:hypothetical protein